MDGRRLYECFSERMIFYYHMNDKNRFVYLRLGDCINFPQKGELVGVHYTLRNEN